MPFFFYSFILFAAAVLGQGIVFTNPAPNDGASASQNPIYAEGSVLHVSWTEGTSSTPTNLVLFQMNGTSLLYPFEYLTQNVVNVTSLDWSVFTSKNLAISNMFVMNIFYEGQTSPVAVSGWFNISSKASTTSSSSSTSSTLSTVSAGPSTNTISSTASTGPSTNTIASTVSTGQSTNTIASTAGSATVSGSSTPSSDTSGGLSTGVKAGIGIGAPLVAILGVGMGYFIFRWRSQKRANTPAMPTAQVQNNADEKFVAYAAAPLQEMNGDSAVNTALYEIYTPEHR